MNNTPDNENNRNQVQINLPQYESEPPPIPNSFPPYGCTAPVYPIPERKKYIYTKVHGIFAILTLILGSVWYRWLFYYHSNGIFKECRALGITFFTVLFFGITISFFRLRKKEIGKDSFIIMCATLIFSIRFALYPTDTDSFIAFLSFFVLHISALLFLYCIGTKNALDKIIGSTFKCVFVAPFASFHRIFVSFSAFFKFRKPATEEEKQKSKKLLINISLVLLTLFCLIPILTIVLSLLFSDGFFSDYLGSISDFINGIEFSFRIRNYVNPITILVSMYIYGAMFSADKKQNEKPDNTHNCTVLPAIVSKTVLISLIIIYILFTIAQIDGFAHMFMGILPEGVTYAEFARSGFFEICAVACINGGVLFLLEILTHREDSSKKIPASKILLLTLTILLIFTAAAKMTMYITAYGFTPKRFYTLWFMLLLTVLFIMTFFKLRNSSFKLSRCSVYVTLAFLTVLFLVDFEWVSVYLNNLIQQ